MAIEIDGISASAVEFRRRLPFHFGNVQVSEGPQVLLEVALVVDGTESRGRSMGSLSPMWFHKDPDMAMAEGVTRMISVIETSIDTATTLDPTPTVFRLWTDLYDAVAAWADGTAHPPLVWTYGVSLVEQAVIDAYCRASGTAFPAAVYDNEFGIELGEVYSELAGFEPADLLPETPQTEMKIRHTVGLEAPLTVDDIPTSDRIDDGLPQAVSEYITQQGIDHFKIKLGATSGDANRLRALCRLFHRMGLDDYAVSLDANEGYASVADFRRQWESLRDDETLATLFDNLLYVEQPLPRDRAFTEDTRRTFAEWSDAPPVIIDESDHRLRSLETALACGYAGTSHKNCKGVFKGIANRCLVAARNRIRDGPDEYVMSGEDLTVHGPIALQQDLAVMATIGMTNVERNGHHYFRGLTDFSDRTQKAALDVHGDLYRRHDRDFVTLGVTDGQIEVASVLASPFGYDIAVEPTQKTPLSRWDVESTFE